MKLLAAIGSIESSFIKNTGSRYKSSAKGVFQFTHRTWITMLREFGEKYGLSIHTSPYDVYANCLMAAEYIKQNVKILQYYLHRKPTYSEIYMAHFLSPLRAVKVIKSSHWENMAKMFPYIASVNYPLFYNRDGVALNAAQFRSEMSRKMNHAMNVYANLANVALIKYTDRHIHPQYD